MSDFRYLVNPTDKEFKFQFDSVEYNVPPKSKKLMLKEVADHGEKRSIFLTDPQIDADGNVISPGNDVFKTCYAEDADVVSPVNSHQPILVEKNKDKVTNNVELSIDPSKPLKKSARSQIKMSPEVINESAQN